MDDLTQPNYLGKECSHCGVGSDHTPVPLWVALFVLSLLITLFAISYMRYAMAKRETETCRAFRQMGRSNHDLSDLIEHR